MNKIKNSYLYKIDETIDEMKSTIKNAESVKSDQLLLIETIESSANSEKFKKFVADLKDSVTDLEHQIEKLNYKLNKLTTLSSIMQKEKTVDEAISLIVEAFSIFTMEN